MADIYDKNKPQPENRPERKRTRISVWWIIAILVILVLAIWIFAFTYGDENAAGAALDTMKTALSDAGMLVSGTGPLSG